MFYGFNRNLFQEPFILFYFFLIKSQKSSIWHLAWSGRENNSLKYLPDLQIDTRQLKSNKSQNLIIFELLAILRPVTVSVKSNFWLFNNGRAGRMGEFPGCDNSKNSRGINLWAGVVYDARSSCCIRYWFYVVLFYTCAPAFIASVWAAFMFRLRRPFNK